MCPVSCNIFRVGHANCMHFNYQQPDQNEVRRAGIDCCWAVVDIHMWVWVKTYSAKGDEHYQLDEFEWPLVVTSNDGNFSQNHVDVHKNSTTYDNKKIQEIEPQTSTAPLLKIVSFLPKWRHVWGFFYPFLDTCAESMAEVFRPQFVPIYSWMGNFYIIGVTTCLKRP